MPADDAPDAVALQLILQLARQRYGYDFGSYQPDSLARRVAAYAEQCGEPDIAALIPGLLRERQAFDRLLQALTVHVTEFYRDPVFFRALLAEVLPQLRSFPRLRVWHAGCASGEEVWSLAVLLQEQGLLQRAELYATDISAAMLQTARSAVYPDCDLQDAELRYRQAGGQAAFAAQFDVLADGNRCAGPALREHVTVSRHNLATDGVFVQVQLILCRNVLIYFNPALKRRVLQLFYESLSPHGFLGLGAQEASVTLAEEAGFELVDSENNIFRRGD